MKYIAMILLSLMSVSSLWAVEINLEAGYVWQHRNDTKIPNPGGTFLEIDEFDHGAFGHYRIDGKVPLSGKHGLRFVYAPFEISVSGQVGQDIDFNGSTFNANQDFTVKYKFNSYRLGYTYNYSDKLTLGLTLKQRDAETRLIQGSTDSAYDNIGYVPLFYFSYTTDISSNWQFYTDMDFAAASQGRAIDLAMRARYKINDSSKLGVGIRSLEGGADNEKVFSFSWFNYFVLEYNYTF